MKGECTVDQFDSASDPVGCVVKRYPRYSETFIVNEICY